MSTLKFPGTLKGLRLKDIDHILELLELIQWCMRRINFTKICWNTMFPVEYNLPDLLVRESYLCRPTCYFEPEWNTKSKKGRLLLGRAVFYPILGLINLATRKAIEIANDRTSQNLPLLDPDDPRIQARQMLRLSFSSLLSLTRDFSLGPRSNDKYARSVDKEKREETEDLLSKTLKLYQTLNDEEEKRMGIHLCSGLLEVVKWLRVLQNAP